ncbi:MAG: glycosyltransferase [Hyphomicrobium sp.]
MRILFIHQNFPGQFFYLARALMAKGHEVLALTADTNETITAIPTARYKLPPRKFDPSVFRTATHYAEMSFRGEAVVRKCEELHKQDGLNPDVIIGHVGWGETLFLKELWPGARLILYAEIFYRTRGQDFNFDPEFRRDELSGIAFACARQAHVLHAINAADQLISPTKWQANSFPDYVRDRVAVIHDGIDTDYIVPNFSTSGQVSGPNLNVRKGDEILTFVNRNLEPYRGFHIFMRALPKVLKARPEAKVIIVGGEDLGYGAGPNSGKTWKQELLHELGARIDLSRVHFVGRVPYDTFLGLMSMTRVHAYLTVPFVLSWSMLQAMSAGAFVVGSKTPPVEEVIQDGLNGLLIDFFDVDAWSDALIAGLSHPERYEAQRLAARQTIVERYDLHSVCLPKQLALVEGF